MRTLLELVPQLQRLGVFEAVGRLGSFTAAARELGISQPAVSRHVGTLEAQLSFALFTRATNRIELTQEGSVLHQAVSQSFESIEATLEGLKDSGNRLVIAAQPSVTQAWLSPNLEQLREQLHPCAISLLVFDRENELEQMDYDVAIRAGHGVWPGRRTKRLIDEEVVPVASPELAESLGLDATTGPDALLDAPLLDISREGRPWMSWQQWFAFQGLNYKPSQRIIAYDSYNTLMSEALSGQGITLTWRHLRGNYVERGLLVEVGSVVHNPSAGHFLTWPPALSRDHRVQVFRDFLRSVVQGQQEA